MPRGYRTDDEHDAMGEHLQTPLGETLGGWPLLPPPDLSETYAQLPQSWQTGAVLLANRILAAAYRADVLQVVEQVLRDVESGAIRGMTIDDYLEEQTEGHQRVVDVNKALQTLQYSPHSEVQPVPDLPSITQMARRCFRADVEQELEAHEFVEFE